MLLFLSTALLADPALAAESMGRQGGLFLVREGR
jgi:hypothetical protein